MGKIGPLRAGRWPRRLGAPNVRNMKALIGAIALVVLCAVARAGEPAPEEISAWRQLSAEYIECVAFYSIVGICMEPADDKSLSERAMKTQDTMLERAVRLTAKAKLKFETIDARSRLSTDSMLEEIGKDCGNLSVLLAKHGKTCRRLFENPKLRELELITEELAPSTRCLIEHENPCSAAPPSHAAPILPLHQ
jgi:hypothetical protein